LIGNGASLGCSTSDDRTITCGIESTFQSNVNGIHNFELFKGDICVASPPVPIKVGEATIDYAGYSSGSPATAIPACKTWSLTPVVADLELVGTQFFFITYRTTAIPVGDNVNFILNLSVQQSLS
jgi:hypothetical protein